MRFRADISPYNPSTISHRWTPPAVGSRPATIAARVEVPFENGGRSSSCSNATGPVSTPPNDWKYALVPRSSSRRVSFPRILRSPKTHLLEENSHPHFDVVAVVESRVRRRLVLGFSWRAVGPRLCWGPIMVEGRCCVGPWGIADHLLV